MHLEAPSPSDRNLGSQIDCTNVASRFMQCDIQRVWSASRVVWDVIQDSCNSMNKEFEML